MLGDPNLAPLARLHSLAVPDADTERAYLVLSDLTQIDQLTLWTIAVGQDHPDSTHGCWWQSALNPDELRPLIINAELTFNRTVAAMATALAAGELTLQKFTSFSDSSSSSPSTRSPIDLSFIITPTLRITISIPPAQSTSINLLSRLVSTMQSPSHSATPSSPTKILRSVQRDLEKERRVVVELDAQIMGLKRELKEAGIRAGGIKSEWLTQEQREERQKEQEGAIKVEREKDPQFSSSEEEDGIYEAVPGGEAKKRKREVKSVEPVKNGASTGPVLRPGIDTRPIAHIGTAAAAIRSKSSTPTKRGVPSEPVFESDSE